MPDYGHPLRFGSFITPVNQPAAHAVDLSQRSEDLGLDLVTFQDHPYRADFHDTWTLLSWVAATTTHIQVAGNVLNLPMRDPAVLARSVAILDLLSGGRVSLGLGAGWQVTEHEQYGLELGEPGARVDRFAEGLAVVSGLLTNQTTTFDGRYYQLSGALCGLAGRVDTPPVWLAAHGPRTLRLTGRVADGWLPTAHGVAAYARELARVRAAEREHGRPAGRRWPRPPPRRRRWLPAR